MDRETSQAFMTLFEALSEIANGLADIGNDSGTQRRLRVSSTYLRSAFIDMAKPTETPKGENSMDSTDKNTKTLADITNEHTRGALLSAVVMAGDAGSTRTNWAAMVRETAQLHGGTIPEGVTDETLGVLFACALRINSLEARLKTAGLY